MTDKPIINTIWQELAVASSSSLSAQPLFGNTIPLCLISRLHSAMGRRFQHRYMFRANDRLMLQIHATLELVERIYRLFCPEMTTRIQWTAEEGKKETRPHRTVPRTAAPPFFSGKEDGEILGPQTPPTTDLNLIGFNGQSALARHRQTASPKTDGRRIGGGAAEFEYRGRGGNECHAMQLPFHRARARRRRRATVAAALPRGDIDKMFGFP